MKKILIVLFALVLVSATAYGQGKGKMALSIGPEVALPMGDAADLSEIGTGFGGTVKFEYGLSNNLVLVGTAGYLMWGGDEVSYTIPGFGTYGASWSWSAIPIFAGVKYYFGKSNFYALGELGFHLFTFDVEYTGVATPYLVDGSTSETEFGFGFGAGYEIPVGKSGAIDLGAKFVIAASDFNFIDIRAGYKFGLGN